MLIPFTQSNFQSVVDRLKAFMSPDRSPAEQAAEKTYPSPTEIGMRHRTLDAGIHIRDDGCVELQSGQTSLLVDGKSGTIAILGKKVVTASEHLVSKARPDGFVVNNGSLNPKWLPAAWELPYTDAVPQTNPVALARSALVTNLAALSQVLVSASGVPIPFSSLVQPVPLYRRTNPALEAARVLEDLLKEV